MPSITLMGTPQLASPHTHASSPIIRLQVRPCCAAHAHDRSACCWAALAALQRSAAAGGGAPKRWWVVPGKSLISSVSGTAACGALLRSRICLVFHMLSVAFGISTRSTYDQLVARSRIICMHRGLQLPTCHLCTSLYPSLCVLPPFHVHTAPTTCAPARPPPVPWHHPTNPPTSRPPPPPHRSNASLMPCIGCEP